tara:strand:- start:5 stop:277 length:273 start_codon:yes stop_codon:yes gene_type:complete
MSEKQVTHTPGPWHQYQSEKDAHKSIASKCGKRIAKHVPNENARLIAVAPEMHEVLSELLEALEISKNYGWDEEYEKVRAILDKVEGEPT